MSKEISVIREVLCAPALDVSVTVEPAVTVVRCAGEIDLSNVDRLKAELFAPIEAGAPAVEVDLRDVEYFDSCTVEALLLARDRQRCEGRILLLRARPFAAQLLRLAGLSPLVDDSPPLAPPGRSQPIGGPVRHVIE